MAAEDSSPREGRTARLVRYTGDVQGVGFRATTTHIASHHPVVGYVKNLPDGRVELYAEGTPEAVVGFLSEVRRYWQEHITDEQSEQQAPRGSHRRFGIAH
jgi:acylphosphatase